MTTSIRIACATRVPFARAINPITRSNWEGVGVEPDTKVPAAAALETALKLLGPPPKLHP